MLEYTNDLVLNVLETQEENLFQRKCQTLLTFNSLENIVNYTKDVESFKNAFTTNVLEPIDIQFILLKKYYLASSCLVPSRLMELIVKDRFDLIDDFFQKDSDTRATLMDTYLRNINTSNYDLALNKTFENREIYIEINETIWKIINYYHSKKLENQHLGPIKQLKKNSLS